MKRVLLTVTTLFGGGAERVVSVWANKLASIGYDVSILLYCRSEHEYPVGERIHIHSVTKTYQDYQKMSYVTRVMGMRRIIKKIRPDVMINFLPRMQIWMMLASIGLKIEKIETVRVNPWVVCQNRRIEQKLWRLCFKRCKAIIVQTQNQSDFFTKKDKKKCIVIPNPIDSLYYNSYINVYSETCINFIAAGRLTPQKNFPLLIKSFALALKENNMIRLKIFGVGDDSYTQYLRQMIYDLHLEEKIYLMGRSHNMPKEYFSSDAFILSSDYEGMPNALVEAMAAGLVCISTDCKTGPKDLIDNEINGFLINVNDCDALAKKIIDVSYMKRIDRETLGRNARDKILSVCSEEKSLKKLISAIEM